MLDNKWLYLTKLQNLFKMQSLFKSNQADNDLSWIFWNFLSIRHVKSHASKRKSLTVLEFLMHINYEIILNRHLNCLQFAWCVKHFNRVNFTLTATLNISLYKRLNEFKFNVRFSCKTITIILTRASILMKGNSRLENHGYIILTVYSTFWQGLVS